MNPRIINKNGDYKRPNYMSGPSLNTSHKFSFNSRATLRGNYCYHFLLCKQENWEEEVN